MPLSEEVMERPSHLSSRIPHPVLSRATSTGLAALLPFAILWALAHQHIVTVAVIPGPLHYTPDPDKPPPRDVPPEPVLTKPVPPITLIPPRLVIDYPSTD